MSKDYVADNAGSGFASFDDDPNDLESLLATAALGEEEDDQETASFFDAEVTEVAKPKAVYTSQTKGIVEKQTTDFDLLYNTVESAASTPVDNYSAPFVEAEAETETEDYYSTVPEIITPVEPHKEQVAYEAPRAQPRSWEKDPNPSFSAPVTTLQSQQQNSYSQASYPTPSAPKASTRIHIPTEADEIALAGKMIRIVDAYRKLNEDVKTVASQFITSGAEIVEDEATLVVKVLNVDPMLPITMRSFREAKALDPVERVFYIISLEDDVLHSLGRLVSVFIENTLDESDTKINYARKLVREIDQLENRAVNYVESTESILAAANGESD